MSVLFILDGRFTVGREQVSMALDITSGADERYSLKQLENELESSQELTLSNNVCNIFKDLTAQ
jgi:hypothetical protein